MLFLIVTKSPGWQVGKGVGRRIWVSLGLPGLAVCMGITLLSPVTTNHITLQLGVARCAVRNSSAETEATQGLLASRALPLASQLELGFSLSL